MRNAMIALYVITFYLGFATFGVNQIGDFTVSPFGGAGEESLLITGWSFESRGNHANLIDSSM